MDRAGGLSSGPAWGDRKTVIGESQGLYIGQWQADSLFKDGGAFAIITAPTEREPSEIRRSEMNLASQGFFREDMTNRVFC